MIHQNPVIDTPPVAQLTLTTARLELRQPRRSDEGLLRHYAGDERVARMTRSIPHPLPPGAAAAFIDTARSANRREDVWILDGTRVGLGEVVGVLGLERLRDREGQSEIGYWIAPAFWNAGLASEAVSAVIEANPQGATSIMGSVFQDNPISARVLTNAGFEYLGDAEAFCVSRGAIVPTWTYLRKI
ncbi:MAG: GNAT family N-acetyltransferase [Pseudomonadota bacterium]